MKQGIDHKKVYLDDERQAPEGYIRAYTVPELISLVKAGGVQEISLDHDLGEGLETGYDFLKWLEAEVYNSNITDIPVIYIHTQNITGRKNMILALQSIRRGLLQNTKKEYSVS